MTAMNFPPELIGKVLEHCPRDVLRTSASCSAIFQLEAERILYRDVLLLTWQSVVLFCDTLTSDDDRNQKRRAAVVKSLRIVTLVDASSPYLGSNGYPMSQALVDRLRRTVGSLHNLFRFGCDWFGPSSGILNALPFGLEELKFSFSVDAPAVRALRFLENVYYLELGDICFQGEAAVTTNGMPIGPHPPHRCSRLKSELPQNHSALRRLKFLAAADCCFRALIPGRPVESMSQRNTLRPRRVEDTIRSITSGTAPLYIIQICTLAPAPSVALLLSQTGAFNTLVALELMDKSYKLMGTGGAHWASETSIGNVIGLFPRLEIFGLETALAAEHLWPLRMASDEEELKMIKRWAQRSPNLKCIHLSIECLTGPLAHRHCMGTWSKYGGKWSQASRHGFSGLLWEFGSTRRYRLACYSLV